MYRKKRILPILIISLSLTACGSSSTSSQTPQPESVVVDAQLNEKETASSETDSSDELVILTEFDDLQTIFCALSYETTAEEVESMISEHGLEYTSKEYNPNKLSYKIAYSADVAKQSYATEGDNLEITFNQDDGSLMNAEYFNVDSFKIALLYNYGTHWDFREDEPNNRYSGYYYHSPGDTKGGITMEYSNGNSKETGYQPCESAEEAVSYAVLDD